MQSLLAPIMNFLQQPTPQQWLESAVKYPDILLIDHAHCEKKAASTALNLIFRYVDRPELLQKMAQLAREELLHFEQVFEIMQQRNIQYDHLTPSRYAGCLRKHIRTYEPARLIDTLIVGALIEARSCERFSALVPYVDEELGRYYSFLLKSESRHFEDYLHLAESYSTTPISERITYFVNIENQLITTEDHEFRFHSGPPLRQDLPENKARAPINSVESDN